MSSTYLAFDLYGTLLDTASVSRKLSEHLPQSINADTVSAEWRRYQLEYTWRLSSMGIYESFDIVTRKSLANAVIEAGCRFSDDAIEDVILSYDQLNVFADVPETLERLKGMPDVFTVIFSNGTVLAIASSSPIVHLGQMVGNSIRNCSQLQPFFNLTSRVRPFVVVGDVKNYKPSPAVYHHLAASLETEHDLQGVWLISGNPFDIVGARRAGLNAIWVDRKGKGWSDQLGEPTRIVKNLYEVVDIVLRL